MTRAVRLQIDGLTKRYGERVAVDDFSAALHAGEFVALLGPNGAGKSTLFQMLTGLFAADAGDAQVAGHSIGGRTAHALRHLGVVFQQPSLDLDLSVRRNLQFHADLHGLPGALARARIDAAAARLGLQADLGRAVRELSGGTRRKVELARALLHHPDVLLMDEPTVGLDPKSRRDLVAAVRADLAERGATVLWATHLVEEAEQADRVIVLHRGRCLADGSPANVAAALAAGGTRPADAPAVRLEDAFIAATRAREPRTQADKETA
jgi:ABC-2 type transport system ATP-binding protein